MLILKLRYNWHHRALCHTCRGEITYQAISDTGIKVKMCLASEHAYMLLSRETWKMIK